MLSRPSSFPSIAAALLGFVIATVAAHSADAQGTSCAVARTQLTTATAAVTRDQQAIASLKFNQNVEALEEWRRLDEKARFDKYMSEAGALISASKALVKAGKSLTPPLANTAITRLRNAGYYEPSLERAIRSIAATPGKPVVGDPALKFLTTIDTARKAVSVSVQPSKWNASLKALSAVLGMVQTSPQLKLLAADLDFATASVYSMYVGLLYEEAIESMTQRTVSDLATLQKLSQQLSTDVDRARSARTRSESAECAPPVATAAAKPATSPASQRPSDTVITEPAKSQDAVSSEIAGDTSVCGRGRYWIIGGHIVCGAIPVDAPEVRGASARLGPTDLYYMWHDHGDRAFDDIAGARERFYQLYPELKRRYGAIAASSSPASDVDRDIANGTVNMSKLTNEAIIADETLRAGQPTSQSFASNSPSNTILGGMAPPRGSAAAPSPTGSAARPLTNADIIELSNTGLSDELIVTAITNSSGDYDIGSEALDELRRHGVTQRQIGAILSKMMVTVPAERSTGRESRPSGLVSDTGSWDALLNLFGASRGDPGANAIRSQENADRDRNEDIIRNETLRPLRTGEDGDLDGAWSVTATSVSGVGNIRAMFAKADVDLQDYRTNAQVLADGQPRVVTFIKQSTASYLLKGLFADCASLDRLTRTTSGAYVSSCRDTWFGRPGSINLTVSKRADEIMIAVIWDGWDTGEQKHVNAFAIPTFRKTHLEVSIRANRR